MTNYPVELRQLPSGRAIPVSVIDPEFEVKDGKLVSIIPLLNESGLAFLAEHIKERIDHRKDCPILVTGDRGAGKSTVTIKVARKVDPEFSSKQVAFRLDEFDQIFNTNPSGDGAKGIYPQVVMDEAGYALHGDEWLAKEQRTIAKELIISRIHRQIIYFTVPKLMDLNNRVRNMTAIWIHVFEPKEYLQGGVIVRLAPVALQSAFAKSKFWVPKFAFTFTEESGPLWDEYEARKVAFVKEVIDDTATGKIHGSKHAMSRDALMKEYYNYRKKAKDPITYEELGEIAKLGKSRVGKILQEGISS